MKQRKVVALIQQRMGSQRFPHKAIADVAGKPMTNRIVERLNRCTTIDELLVILPKEAETSLLADALGEIPFKVFDIRPQDVLGRHQRAAQVTEADVIVRVPGDNPCVDPVEVDRMVKHFLAQPAPTGQWLYTNLDQNVLDNDYPGGVGCEVYSAWFLHWLHMNMRVAKYREHPHLWAFELGRLRTIPAPWKAGHLKLSVDTPDELAMINAIYHRCPPNFTTQDILDFVGDLPHGLRRSDEHGGERSEGPSRGWHLDDAEEVR